MFPSTASIQVTPNAPLIRLQFTIINSASTSSVYSTVRQVQNVLLYRHIPPPQPNRVTCPRCTRLILPKSRVVLSFQPGQLTCLINFVLITAQQLAESICCQYATLLSRQTWDRCVETHCRSHDVLRHATGYICAL